MTTNKVEDQGLIIFGASGDLTYRKLIPAVFHIYEKGLLPKNFFVLGVGRTELTDSDFRNKMKEGILKFVKNLKEEISENKIDFFLNKLYYQPIDTSNSEDFNKLKLRINDLNDECETKNNFLFYLSIPPSLYSSIANDLANVGLNKPPKESFRRLIIEKPFGVDYKTAEELNKALLKNYKEDQIYRIDHYMGKETVQNIFVTRFANGIFEPLWNRNYIDYVEITSSENIGVENRGGYYDNAGAMRDMFQNHLLQLIAIVAMEPPVTLDSESIRNEKMKVFEALRKLTPDDIKKNVVFGQYTSSKIKGEKIKGYREEPGIYKESRTETFFAMKFFIDNWRWSGVPFFVRTGKRMPTRVTEVVIHFKPAPNNIFGSKNAEEIGQGNNLIIRIQPDEGLLLKTMMKIPGAGYDIKALNMDFHYTKIENVYISDAYERLLLDAMMGDNTLYIREDALMQTWKFVQPILDYIKQGDMSLHGYPSGTWGPEEANDLLKERKWRFPCKNLSNDGIYCEL